MFRLFSRSMFIISLRLSGLLIYRVIVVKLWRSNNSSPSNWGRQQTHYCRVNNDQCTYFSWFFPNTRLLETTISPKLIVTRNVLWMCFMIPSRPVGVWRSSPSSAVSGTNQILDRSSLPGIRHTAFYDELTTPVEQHRPHLKSRNAVSTMNSTLR